LIPRKKADLESWKLRETRARQQVAKVKEIEKAIKQISERKIGVEKLQNDRRLWAPILYRLCDPEVVPPRVWYKKMGLKNVSHPRQTPRTYISHNKFIVKLDHIH